MQSQSKISIHTEMRSRAFAVIAVLLLFGTAALAQSGQTWSRNTSPLPAPTGFVNDYYGAIDAATKQQLETKLKDFRDTTDPSVEIAVVVIKSTEGRDIFDYSLAVARGWGIGSKAEDNPSALLLVAVEDRKYFTQISKDLEDELPDGVAGSLQRQYLVPEFRKGNYSKGIADTIDAYIETIRNKGNAPVARATKESENEFATSEVVFPLFCCGALILFVLVVGLSAASKNKPDDDDRNRWGGGGSGVSDAIPWIIGGLIDAASSGGSSSSSDWGSSGGSDWGGFSGGGDFGGGGSGGSW